MSVREFRIDPSPLPPRVSEHLSEAHRLALVAVHTVTECRSQVHAARVDGLEYAGFVLLAAELRDTLECVERLRRRLSALLPAGESPSR